MLKKIAISIVFLVVIAAVLGGIGYQQIFGSRVAEDTSVFIYDQTTYTELVEVLISEGLVNDDFTFNTLSQKMNLPNHVHSGHYQFYSGESYFDIIQKLRGGMQTPVNLTINNLVYLSDLAGKVSKQTALDSMQVLEALEALPYSDSTLCYFIPNTYEIYWNLSSSSFMDKMEGAYSNFWNADRLSKAKALDLSPNQVYVLASIVEKEYKYAEERERIAGVYLNRLDLGMKLQADPTVKYAVGDLGLRRVLNVHTAYDHPYNTYYYKGLPPGPICMPESTTIDAVLNAEEHQFYYFCARPDLSGYHTFNEFYSKHLETASLYQAALNKLSIYE